MHLFQYSLFHLRDTLILDSATVAMKFSLLVFFYLLTAAVCFFSCNISVSSPSVIFLTGRRSMKEQRMLPLHINGQEKNKVLDEDAKQMTIHEHAREHQHLSNNDLDLVYHIDYHGVTTHPIPTPKHPRP
ncbi:hypothetical protein P3X46_034577 [Hevea brasiliensis]|uniref:Uncharacterized protein n=2 Tax=Hevea brasiliensis TaxID=3981 RepID=A0ABQ9KBE8_HEVBR|nr:hypothetical protein P3X46_034577 [Hevea brasiliensis]